VTSCVAAGIAKGEVVHIDATLIRADVAWESLGVRHADAILAQDEADASDSDAAKRKTERDAKQSGKFKKICLTDPDATMATNARNRRLDPAYKQHTAVDDIFGVILDVQVTTGEANEGDHVLPQIDAVTALTGVSVKTATADQGYAYGKVYGGLGATQHRSGHSGQEGADQKPCAATPVPLRR